MAAANDALKRRALASGLAAVDSAHTYAPNSPIPWFLEGRLYFELGRLNDARAAYRDALALDADFEGAWHNLGNVAFQQRKYREALGYYEREVAHHNSPQS